MATRRQTLRHIASALVIGLILTLACSFATPVPSLADSNETDVVGAPASSVGLDDGMYTIDVALEGGSGRATIESPTRLEVYQGRAYVIITWSSPHFDYMKVHGKKYLPTNMEGNSTFEIPIDDLDETLKVVADTTAMSKPHEIKYKLTFDRDSLKREFRPSDLALPVAVGAAVVILLGFIFLWSRRQARRITDSEE